MKLSTILATSLALSSPAFADDNAAATTATSATPPEPGIWEWSRLTGDWGGLRTQLAKHGLSLDFESTHFYQGLFSGSGDHDFDYGGRLDAFVNVDTGKLGLWEGGGLRTHTEYRYAELQAFRDGALWPVNTAQLLPLGSSEEVVASSIYLTQKIGDRTTVMLGKINAVDLLATSPFFGGWGTRRFMNIAFVAPPSGVLPPVIMGGIASFRTAPITWTLMVYDPNDRTKDYWPDHFFSAGVNTSLSATYAGKLAERTTTYTLGGIYSTKEGANLSEVLLPPDLKTGGKRGSYSVSFQFTHLLQESAERPGDGWGIFVKTAICDGNPNPIQSYVTGGIGGKGLIPGRKDDSFGLGYFYYNFSDDLQRAVSPLVKFGNEQGGEVFYNYAVTPWFHMTADLQIIAPANRDASTAVASALRANIRF